MVQHVDFTCRILTCQRPCQGMKRGRGGLSRTLTDLTALISCFCVRDLRQRSMTVWWSSVLALRCFVHMPVPPM